MPRTVSQDNQRLALDVSRRCGPSHCAERKCKKRAQKQTHEKFFIPLSSHCEHSPKSDYLTIESHQAERKIKKNR
jgi:hypothetical protein